VNGEARVTLGETFQWVANPDIGLTAHVTARTPDAVLYVESVGTTELAVRAVDGFAPDAEFDYVVYGLRLGYEQMAPVQDKRDYAPVPELDATAPYYAKYPELRHFNALERYTTMHEALGRTGEVDLIRTRELVAAVNRIDPEYDVPLLPGVRQRADEGHAGHSHAPRATEPVTGPDDSAPESSNASVKGTAAMFPMDAEGNVYAKSFRPSASDLASLAAVAEPVEAGDVLVIDPRQAGVMSLARQTASSAVFGIVAADPGVVLGTQPPPDAGTYDEGGEETPVSEAVVAVPEPIQVPVALSGVALCKVDAGYGSILPGDLLTTSPSPGHAMRTDEPLPGTILGKALEPLDTGTGLIKVLVMLR
jgi:hypothetical protein